jgi:hypothetical protein
VVKFPETIPADWPETCSQKDFAALVGMSAPAVCKHGKAGRLVMRDKRVVVRASIEAIRRNTHPGRGGDRTAKRRAEPATARETFGPYRAPGSASDGGESAWNYQEEAAREKRASAQLREMEVAEKAGHLVVKDLRDHAEFTRARHGREAIMSIPDRLAVQLAPALPVEEVHSILSAECRRICELLATGVPPVEVAA